MTKTIMVKIKRYILAPFWGASVVLLFASCSEITEVEVSDARLSKNDTQFYGTGYGYVYKKSPFDANNFSLPSSALAVDNWISTGLVTTNNELIGTCDIKANDGSFDVQESTNNSCIYVLENDNPDTIAIQSKNGGWNYSARTEKEEFYQVNTFYHSNLIIERFMHGLYLAHSMVHFPLTNKLPPVTKYDPQRTFSFWFNDSGINSPLYVYAMQPLDSLNAFFSSSDPAIAMGYTPGSPITDYSVEDLSILYHEYGHAFNYLLMNQRNTSFQDGQIPKPDLFSGFYYGTPYKSSLGTLAYDEGGAINEGLSDFFAYFITERKDLGEWAFNFSPRPMTETSQYHSANVTKNSGERLKYPEFVHYFSGYPYPDEDVHNAGQIIAHYLVSLTEEFKSTCSYVQAASGSETDTEHIRATALTLMLLSETLGEMGDMTARGSDIFDPFKDSGDSDDVFFGSFFTNLNAFNAYLWAHSVKPVTFRRFARLMARNIKYRVSDPLVGVCNSFTVDDSEELLDEYGLLLFRDYDEDTKGTEITDMGTYVIAQDKDVDDFDGQNVDTGFSSYDNQVESAVNELNRKQTVLISKDFIDFPTDSSGEPKVFIFDKQAGMQELLASLTFEGQNVQISEGLAGPEYNNGNIKVSPGEIIGITPNLYNFSNSQMGGVRILANDWDHMKLDTATDIHVNSNDNMIAGEDIANWSPCQFDGWPLETEGGILEDDTLPASEGDCLYTTKHNLVLKDTAATPEYYPDASQPVCLVQYSDENETRWVSQDFYRTSELILEDNECLNGPSMSGNEFNPNECLVRVLPGGSQTIYGKVNPQSTWQKTLQGTNPQAPNINTNHIIVMEINKLISPGTTFNCRFRVNFSNCADCFDDENGNEYPDYMHAGEKPFKVINFSFKVLD
jgi:hypothetical protein